ncbi:hypothetical protein T4B_5498 [Trichinella pseudospiralis]|uniref:Uncharacterized protein n=1 Tax=Trichinella pseudospiralis TaxID=6337 RepID=A0A0V1JKP2_TRIPS|nr:hypothetical protein T4B_5498 [Trichinella pseudospiralis]KRZ35529.1 hypothetical protein T4C_11678 [Trichinella pseudospiralis]
MNAGSIADPYINNQLFVKLVHSFFEYSRIKYDLQVKFIYFDDVSLNVSLILKIATTNKFKAKVKQLICAHRCAAET